MNCRRSSTSPVCGGGMSSPWKKKIDWEVPESPCPSCGAMLNGSGEAMTREGTPPVMGDIAICIRCAAVNRYGLGMALEAVPEDELAKLLIDTDLLEALAAVRCVIDQRKR